MKIQNFDTDDQVFIIAEIGNNHEGDFNIAKEMIDAALECGVDAVKFQTFITHEYVSEIYDQKRYSQLKGYELSHDQFHQLNEYAIGKGGIFISTPFDVQSAEFLGEFVTVFKISSSDLDFYPLLKMLASSEKPIIFSSGFHALEQVYMSLDFIGQFRTVNKDNTTLLHCVGNYPTLSEDANLHTIDVYRKLMKDVTIGYSDHTIGVRASVLASAKGARVIEKHFTLDKNFSDFHDHKISADPSEMKQIVQEIREVEILSGIQKKRVNSKEREILKLIGRKMIARYDLPAGKVLEPDDVSWVRLVKGIAPRDEKQLMGKTLTMSIPKGNLIDIGSVA